MERSARILISGASFAGLTTAYWMNEQGYEVTIVESGNGLKKGGTPVDIKDETVEIVKRMGIYDQIRSNRVGPEKWEFMNEHDITEFSMKLDKQPDNEFEVERDVLLAMLFNLVENKVRFIFDNSITMLNESDDCVDVEFRDGTRSRYSLVIGCDGIHSAVRRIAFGDESRYVHYLGQYFAIAVVDKLLVDNGTYQMYAEPNKGVALYAHNHRTDVICTFRMEHEIAYDFRNQEQQKEIVSTQLEGMRWRTRELRTELLDSDSFYFDKFCQVKMPSWTNGRIALVGDAAYCASPAAGMGGSLAIIGGTALADAFAKQDGKIEAAFKDYNTGLRPFIEQVQAGAVTMLDKLLPRTEEEVRERNRNGMSF